MNKKIVTVFIYSLLICSCSNVTYEAFESLSSKEVEIIYKSYFKKYSIKKNDYKNYKIESHLITINENISIDVIKHSESGSDASCTINSYYINDKYVCSFPDYSYSLNVCDLSINISYSLEDAYANQLIDDNGIDSLIQIAEEKGYRYNLRQ